MDSKQIGQMENPPNATWDIINKLLIPLILLLVFYICIVSWPWKSPHYKFSLSGVKAINRQITYKGLVHHSDSLILRPQLLKFLGHWVSLEDSPLQLLIFLFLKIISVNQLLPASHMVCLWVWHNRKRFSRSQILFFSWRDRNTDTCSHPWEMVPESKLLCSWPGQL